MGLDVAIKIADIFQNIIRIIHLAQTMVCTIQVVTVCPAKRDAKMTQNALE